MTKQMLWRWVVGVLLRVPYLSHSRRLTWWLFLALIRSGLTTTAELVQLCKLVKATGRD